MHYKPTVQGCHDSAASTSHSARILIHNPSKHTHPTLPWSSLALHLKVRRNGHNIPPSSKSHLQAAITTIPCAVHVTDTHPQDLLPCDP
jgi:hypothetical protein